jgi:mercuric ion transport protein
MAVEAKGSRGASSERMGVAKALSMGGILAALGASSCCVIPFVLFSLGVSGAWIADLTALAPYQPLFVAAALACLAGGFVLVRRAARAACAGGASCARPASGSGRRRCSSSWPSPSRGWRRSSSRPETGDLS